MFQIITKRPTRTKCPLPSLPSLRVRLSKNLTKREERKRDGGARRTAQALAGAELRPLSRGCDGAKRVRNERQDITVNAFSLGESFGVPRLGSRLVKIFRSDFCLSANTLTKASRKRIQSYGANLRGQAHCKNTKGGKRKQTMMIFWLKAGENDLQGKHGMWEECQNVVLLMRRCIAHTMMLDAMIDPFKSEKMLPCSHLHSRP